MKTQQLFIEAKHAKIKKLEKEYYLKSEELKRLKKSLESPLFSRIFNYIKMDYGWYDCLIVFPLIFLFFELMYYLNFTINKYIYLLNFFIFIFCSLLIVFFIGNLFLATSNTYINEKIDHIQFEMKIIEVKLNVIKESLRC